MLRIRSLLARGRATMPLETPEVIRRLFGGIAAVLNYFDYAWYIIYNYFSLSLSLSASRSTYAVLKKILLRMMIVRVTRTT